MKNGLLRAPEMREHLCQNWLRALHTPADSSLGLGRRCPIVSKQQYLLTDPDVQKRG
jgi:hypothetical protein